MGDDVYREIACTPETAAFIASRCLVRVDVDSYFIHVETDEYEGDAMMTLPCAIEVHRLLGEAIRVANEKWKLLPVIPQPQPEGHLYWWDR